jgi:hypothetical protein
VRREEVELWSYGEEEGGVVYWGWRVSIGVGCRCTDVGVRRGEIVWEVAYGYVRTRLITNIEETNLDGVIG